MILFGWGVMYFVVGVLMFLLVVMVGFVCIGGFIVYNVFEYFVCWIDGFLIVDVDLIM